MNCNVVLIGGNISNDIDLKYMPNGSAVTQFSLAINRKYNTKDGERKEEVSFIKVVCYGKLAENVKEYCGKGSGVFVEGRLKQERWDASDGSKRDRTVVIGENIQFINTKRKTDTPEDSDEDMDDGL